jgi:hypothetical protein
MTTFLLCFDHEIQWGGANFVTTWMTLVWNAFGNFDDLILG